MLSSFAVLSLIGVINSILIGAFVYSRNPNNPQNRVFAFLAAFLAYSGFCEFMMRQSAGYDQALMWIKTGCFWPVIFALLLHFLLVYSEKKPTILNFLFFYLPAFAFSFIDLATPLLSGFPKKMSWGYSNSNQIENPILIIQLIWLALVVIYAFYLLFNYYSKQKNPIKMQQTNLLILSMLAPLIAFIITEEYAPLKGLIIPELGNTSLAIMALIISYGIWKFELFSASSYAAAQSIVSTMPDGLIITNHQLTITEVNQFALNFLGYENNDLVGKPLDFLIDNADFPIKKEAVAKMVENRYLGDFSSQMKTKAKGKIPVRIYCSTVKSDDNRIKSLIFIVHDVSDVWKLMEETKILQQELIESDKLAALGKLAAGIAHEINNPLFVISGESEMLKDHAAEETKNSARIISTQAKRIKEITANLASFISKGVKFERESVSLNELMDKTLSLISYQIKMEDIVLYKDYYPDLPKILGSSVQLEQVFINILQNAVQAMYGRGTLAVKTRQESIDNHKMAVVEITDSGTGMTEEIKRRIFDPFFSTKDTGLGLGLAICAKIVENHKGKIEIESAPGKGTTFLICLPVYEKLLPKEAPNGPGQGEKK